MGISATSGPSGNSGGSSTPKNNSTPSANESGATNQAAANNQTGGTDTSPRPSGGSETSTPDDRVTLSDEAEDTAARSLPNLGALDPANDETEEVGGSAGEEAAPADESSPTEETSPTGEASPTDEAGEATPTEEASPSGEATPTEEVAGEIGPELSDRVSAIQDLMAEGSWNAGPEEARAAAAAVAEQLEGLSLDDRMRVLEQQGALGALSEHMQTRLEEDDRSVGGHLDVLEPFAGMLTPAQVEQAGTVTGDALVPEEIGRAYNFLDTVREQNPDPLAQQAAGRAAAEGGAMADFSMNDILSGQVPDFTGQQLTGLIAAADDPEIESRYSQKVENRFGRPPEHIMGGHELRGERTLEEQIQSRVDAVRDYQWEESAVDLPEGGSRLERTFTDESGATITEADILGTDGALTGRQSTITEVAEGNINDVEGLGFLSGVQDNPQGLLNELREMGDPTVTDIQTLTETVGEDGTLLASAEARRSWNWDEDGTTLSRIDNGPGTALEWELKRPIDEDGRTGIATQRFVQGSMDTSVHREFTDEHGFQVETLDESLHDISEQVREDGGELPVEVERVLASSDTARLADLERYLGPEAMAELSQNEDFQHLLEGFGENPFEMAYSRNASTFEGEEGERTEFNEMLSLQAEGRDAILSRNEETGRWSFAYTDGEGERGRIIGDDNSAIEFDPQSTQLRAANGDITQLRTDARVLETGADSVQRGSRLARTLGSRMGRIGDLLSSIDNGSGANLMDRYGKGMDGLGMGINAIAAFQHFNAGNLEGAALSGAGAAMDVGALMRNGTGAVSSAARMLGFAGAAYTGYVGVQQMVDGDYVRGGLSLATGVGAGMGIASGIAGTAGWLGPAGWTVSAGATLGGVAYDYWDRTEMAPVLI